MYDMQRKCSDTVPHLGNVTNYAYAGSGDSLQRDQQICHLSFFEKLNKSE